MLWDSKLPGPASGATENDTDHHPLEVHRLKGRLPLSNGDVKIVQGVREVFEILDSPEAGLTEVASNEQGKIVLIGRNLNNVDFEKSFINAIKS